MTVRTAILLLLLLIVVSIVLYVYHLNPEPVVVSYRAGTTWTAPLAVVLITAFCTGAMTMALVALSAGVKLRLTNWRSHRKQEMLQQHYSQVTAAREQLALGDFDAAKSMLLKVINRDPNDVNARILLAESYRRAGEPQSALRVLEESRAEQKKNAELLLLASDLNAELGNHTASFDNASMVLKLVPKNREALERLVHDCRALHRFNDAIEYQKQRIRLAPAEQQDSLQEELAQLELESAVLTHQTDVDARRGAIQEVLKRHRNFPPALAALGELECDRLELQAATDLWKKAYHESRQTHFLQQIAVMWLEADEPQRAIDSVRSALSTRSSSEQPDIDGHLFMVKLLLHLEHVDEAKREFEYFKSLVGDRPEYAAQVSLITARLHERHGDLERAFSALLGIFDNAEALPGKPLFPGAKGANGQQITWKSRVREKLRLPKQPSPTLSTP